jgi:outer membrane lipoprotein SlyB
MKTTLLALLALPSLALSGCVHTYATTQTWGEPQAAPHQTPWVRYGRVESIRETVYHQQGDPAGGAVAGAIIGGLLGGALGGHHGHHGYYHHGGAGALVGAVGGAMIGAAASQGQGESRTYQVFVRFEDGGLEPFVYRNVLPFQVGDEVAFSPQGLMRRQ